MRIFLGKFKLFTFILLLTFCGNVNAQCTITGATSNASTYNPNPCTILTSCGGILYIGDGVNPTSLTMNAALNLSCLGAIQLIVRNNASIDFSPGNFRLTLAEGSSIFFEGTGTLVGGSCNASERIYIGTDLIATCNGGAGADFSFPLLVAAGGFNIVNITPTSASACGSGSFSFTATAVPSATATYVRWYSVASGGSPLLTTPGSSSVYTTPTISTTTTYYAEATIGAFITPRKAVVATINPFPSAPTIGTITQPTCTNPTLGSVVLNGLPASVTWTLTRSGTSSATTTGTGTSTTISGLAVGTYAFTVSNATCTSAVSSNVVISSLVTNTWKGIVLGWDVSTPPTADQKIVFDSADLYTLNSDIVACSCQAKSDVTIKSGYTLTLTNELEVVGLANMVFEDDASLVQTRNVITNSNLGNIEYNRMTESRNSDYTYWSSPVLSSQPLGGVTGVFPKSLAGTFYSFDSSINPANWKNESSGTSMIVGKGYIARGPETLLGTQTPPDTQFTTTFSGVPNNGDVTVPVPDNANFYLNPITDSDFGVSYLLGNPYPSALDAETFLDNNSLVLEGTIYFWTHKTQIGIGVSEPGTGVYAYSGADYATYNSVGGVAVGSGAASTSGSTIPNGKIAAGQGFFATAKATGDVKFTNSMRVAGNNSQFFKKRNSKTEKVIEKNRVWLNLTNTQGAFKQTLVGYITNATNNYDDRFDGESFDGNEFVDFYSVNQDKNLVIQGRALPFDENDEVPLGYRTTIKGAFTISIDQVDGSLTNQAVFIEDKLTNTVTDLKSGNYTFNTVAGTFNDRFVLRYKNNSTAKTLAASKFDALENTVLVSSKNKQIKINSFTETIEKVTIYDLQGRQIYQKDKVNSSEFSIANLVSSRQLLVVKTVLQNGVTVTDKIIY